MDVFFLQWNLPLYFELTAGRRRDELTEARGLPEWFPQAKRRPLESCPRRTQTTRLRLAVLSFSSKSPDDLTVLIAASSTTLQPLLSDFIVSSCRPITGLYYFILCQRLFIQLPIDLFKKKFIHFKHPLRQTKTPSLLCRPLANSIVAGFHK